MYLYTLFPWLGIIKVTKWFKLKQGRNIFKRFNLEEILIEFLLNCFLFIEFKRFFSDIFLDL